MAPIQKFLMYMVALVVVPVSGAVMAQQFVGNTVQIAGLEISASIDENGTWRGQHLPNGAKSGKWWLSDNGVLCSKPDVAETKVNCDIVRSVGEPDFKGNSRKL